MDSRTVKTLFKDSYEDIRPTLVSIDSFQDIRSILVIHSANLNLLKKFIQTFQAKNPRVYFYVVTHSRDAEEASRLVNKGEILLYSDDGPFEISKMNKIFSCLKPKTIDCFFLLYNNRYGIDYENVEEILTSVTTAPYFAFNGHNEILKIQEPRKRINGLRLIRAISNWYWEQLS